MFAAIDVDDRRICDVIPYISLLGKAFCYRITIDGELDRRFPNEQISI
jgi:hypothetical protein